MWFKKTQEEKQAEKMVRLQEEAVMAEVYKVAGQVYQEQSAKYTRGNADRRDVSSALLAKGYPKWKVDKAVDYIFSF